MKYWARRVVKPFCEDFGYQTVCEIGASFGGATDIVLETKGVRLDVIDPCLDTDLCAKYSHEKRLTLHKGLSLDVLPKLSGKFDCILIDGDHNWYTVFNELKAIDDGQLLKSGGTIFFHDVGWPYGRRDMYYQPETVPREFRQPYAAKGIIYGRSELSSTGGENREFYNAEKEGGTKNGVLTAIEDFLKGHENEYVLFRFKDECGLGVLVKKDGLKSGAALARWRRHCLIHNIFGNVKLVFKHRFPGLYRMVRGAAKT